MANRKRIDIGPTGTFVIECDGQRYAWTDCYVMAEIAFMPAAVFDYVLKARDGKLIRLVVVADSEDYGNRVSRGWYAAYGLSEAEAMQWRQSWSVLREQPPLPSGPWA